MRTARSAARSGLVSCVGALLIGLLFVWFDGAPWRTVLLVAVVIGLTQFACEVVLARHRASHRSEEWTA